MLTISHKNLLFKVGIDGVEKMISVTVPAEDLSLVLGTQVRLLTIAYDSSPKGFTIFFWTLDIPPLICTNAHAYSHTYIQFKKAKKIKLKL